MESSRDDFVIAIRSAFLKKGTQQRFSLLGLIFFSIIFLILGSFNFKIVNYVKISIKEVIYRSSYIISGPENLVKTNYSKIKNHFTLYKENEKNTIDLENLRSSALSNRILILENNPRGGGRGRGYNNGNPASVADWLFNCSCNVFSSCSSGV